MYELADVEAGGGDINAFQREPILARHNSYSSDDNNLTAAPYAPQYSDHHHKNAYEPHYKSEWEGDPAKQPLTKKGSSKKNIPDLPLIDQNMYIFKLFLIVGVQLTLASAAAAFCLNRREVRRWLASPPGEIFTGLAGAATFAIHCSFKCQKKGKCKALSKRDNWILLIVFTILEGILLSGTACIAAQSDNRRIAWGGVVLIQAFAHSAVICALLSGTAFFFRRKLEVAHPKSLMWVILVVAGAIGIRFLCKQVDDIDNPIWHTFVLAAAVCFLGMYLVFDARRIVKHKGGYAYKNDLAGGAMELYSDYASVLIAVFTLRCVTIGKCKICTEPLTEGNERAQKGVKCADVFCKYCM